MSGNLFDDSRPVAIVISGGNLDFGLLCK